MQHMLLSCDLRICVWVDNDSIYAERSADLAHYIAVALFSNIIVSCLSNNSNYYKYHALIAIAYILYSTCNIFKYKHSWETIEYLDM